MELYFWNTSEPNGGTGKTLITYSTDGHWNDSYGECTLYFGTRVFSNPNESDTDEDGFPDYNET